MGNEENELWEKSYEGTASEGGESRAKDEAIMGNEGHELWEKSYEGTATNGESRVTMRKDIRENSKWNRRNLRKKWGKNARLMRRIMKSWEKNGKW